MNISRLGARCLIAACVLALGACKSGDDDDDNNNTGTGGTGSGGTTAGSGGASAGSGGAGSGGAMAMGTGGKGGSGGTGSGGKGGSGGTGSGGTGSGGTGSGGSGMDAGTDAMTGSATNAMATIAGFSGGTVTGTAVFTQSGTDVTVVVTLMNCADGMHPVHIHDGTSCADATAQGAHWGPARGEGIPSVMCSGMTGTAMLTRKATPADTAWTIGGAAATDVVGHAFVVHNNDDAKTRIGCGVIMAD